MYYFKVTNPQFGVDEQVIDNLIQDRFQLAIINYNKQAVSSVFKNDWNDLGETICKRNDYKTNICLYEEFNTLYLFGLAELVKEFDDKFQQLINKHKPQSCKITLSERQVQICKSFSTTNYLNCLTQLERHSLAVFLSVLGS